ncbi:hypothetical protein PLICRDRAFT_281394 [Plicaturopsis crispa FD-325 SS-3]|nr:hypothetical protein PLICRDRAFT_281394 [Plicaturopsis crispa FD-325 SS-3]
MFMDGHVLLGRLLTTHTLAIPSWPTRTQVNCGICAPILDETPAYPDKFGICARPFRPIVRCLSRSLRVGRRPTTSPISLGLLGICGPRRSTLPRILHHPLFPDSCSSFQKCPQYLRSAKTRQRRVQCRQQMLTRKARDDV